jgi:predicted RNA methylase
MPHNKRFPEQWRIITDHIDLTDKTIVDAGCGYGDMVKALIAAGAGYVFAYDIDKGLCERLQALNLERVCISNEDINTWQCDASNFKRVDFLICFSVLPYLTNPFGSLRIFKCYARQCLIECQYKGDGPGFKHIHNDDDMIAYLHQAGFRNVVKLGETEIKDRNAVRPIWRCW